MNPNTKLTIKFVTAKRSVFSRAYQGLTVLLRQQFGVDLAVQCPSCFISVFSLGPRL